MGDEENLIDAETLARTSFRAAMEQVSQSELKQARDAGHLSDEQYLEITKLARLEKLKTERARQSQSESSHFRRR